MCSSNDCSFNDNVELSVGVLPINGRLCRKCKCKNIDVLLIGQSGYCKTCFLTAINHKFRATLGKSKITRTDSILIDHSTELNSTVLLHLLKAGMNESTCKKLMFKIAVLYIDDNIITKKPNEERYVLRSKIIEQLKDFGFTGYIISLNEILKEKDDIDIKFIDHQEVDNENDNYLYTILSKLSDNTSKIDLLDKLRQKLLITVARRLNCNIIFQANSVMDTAIKVLGDICLGRSTQLSTLTNFCDAQCAGIKILKPMKDFTQQELLYYSECYNIDSIKSKEFNASSSMKSIQSLTHDFIIRLESQFPGTVSAISRIAEKLSVKGNEEQNVGNDCILCDAKLDFISHNNEISAMRAIEVSRLISSEYVVTKNLSSNKKNKESICKNLLLDNEKCCNDNANCIKNNAKSKQESSEDIQKYLCYSCKLIFRNLNIRNIFPKSLLLIIEQKLALKKMRKEINDFLL